MASTGAAALDDIGDIPVTTAGGDAAGPDGKTWLRQRSDWAIGSESAMTLIVLAPLSDFTAFFDSIGLTLLLLAVAVLFAIIPSTLWISGQLSRPLSDMARDAERVSRMDFGGNPAAGSWIDEIDKLGSGYARMKEAINENRGQIEAQRDSYARFLPGRMLELFDKTSVTDVKPRDCKTLELTVMFSDIRSYTAISEGLSCDGIFDLLNTYFEITNPIIEANGGIIDKYIGDAILSVFPDSPAGALRSAIAINRALRLLNDSGGKFAGTRIRTGTGIHFGAVDLGTVGDRSRLQATVIGDAVNLASRLESATKTFGVSILISEAAIVRLENPGEFRCRQIDTVRVKGKEFPIKLFEAFDLDDPPTIEGKEASAADFAEALSRYKSGDFPGAMERFGACAARCPEDTVAAAYITRCATLMRVPPGEGWAGVSTL